MSPGRQESCTSVSCELMVARIFSRVGKFFQCTDCNDLLPNDTLVDTVCLRDHISCTEYRWLKLKDASTDLAIKLASMYSENTKRGIVCYN